MRLAALAAALVLTACATPAGREDWPSLADRVWRQQLAAHPQRGVVLGLHQYDGRLAPADAGSLKQEVSRLQLAESRLLAVRAAALPARHRLERDALLIQVRGDRFRLEELRSPWRDPTSYLPPLELADYISRPYDKASARARAIAALCRTSPSLIAAAKANLEPQLPRVLVTRALQQLEGMLSFADSEVPAALAELPSAAAAELRAGLAAYRGALADYRAFLQARLPTADENFALGEQRLLGMLAATQGLSVDLGTLERLARDDLARNSRAMAEAARAIDPSRSTAEVVAQVSADKPAADRVLDLAAEQLGYLRQLVSQHGLVSLPHSVPIHPCPTPSFLRWNFACIDAAGPFEPRPLAARFYLSPPDPAWPAARQRAYLLSRADLLFTAAHEVWPGHFLAFLHLRQQPSPILKSFIVSSVAEGWAHCAEELLWEQALSVDARLHIGQLKLALLRNVRFIVAIGLHVRGMSVDRAAGLFEELAFADPATARQQAERGAFDPMFLAYTLGKLAVRKLRDDWRAQVGPHRSLRELHDALLAIGPAPSLPAIRRELLGERSGPVL